MRGVSGRVWSRAVVLTLCLSAGLLVCSATVLAAQAPKVQEQWVTKVSGSSATLWAKINPGEAATTYRFEYATSEAALLAGHGERIPMPPTPEGDAGEGDAGVVVQAHSQILAAHTSYWYRVVATNKEGETPGCQAQGTCPTFTTQPPGGELVLPNGRAWELVSPPPAGAGATPVVENFSSDGKIIEAAEDGGAFTFVTRGATEAAPEGNAAESSILSVRAPGGGWSSKDIASPHEHQSGEPNDTGQEYRFFSPDLSVALVEPAGTTATGTSSVNATPLSPGVSERTVYVRDDQPLPPDVAERTVYGEAEREAYPGAEAGYRPLVTGCPAAPAECQPRVQEDADVPEGTKFSEFAQDRQHPKFDGAAPDLSHVIVESEVPLTAETPEKDPTVSGVFGLWEWTSGIEAGKRLQIVSVLPDGEQSQAGSVGFGSSNGDDARGAISNDGSRVVWSAGEHLYLRDVSREQTVQIDEPDEGAAGGEYEAVFQFANSDGSEVFFTDRAQLTKNSTASQGHSDLYECVIVEVEEAGGKKVLKCKLSDLTVYLGGAGVQGVVDVGSSEDTSLYFLARGELTSKANAQGAEAKVGEPNVYLLHFDGETNKWEEPAFIATLSERDYPDFAPESGLPGDLEQITSRVSPDGEYLAFMSELPLTGYDNRDASSGELDEELFLYRAPSTGAPAGRLVCASCNPSGSRPHGVQDERSAPALLADPERLWNPTHPVEPSYWLAASVPGWTNMEEAVARYQSRYLSDSGRLFFDSPDDLVPQATNGLMDVYEYEPEGTGSCESTGGTFSRASGGCVGLVSSGSSGEESAFLDASENGDDVFFLSSAQLVPADTGSALAVYDAHVCSAASPCASEAVAPPQCTTADACRAAPTPQPQVFGAPSSATFAGAGNLTPSPPTAVKPEPKTVKCTKGKHLSHNKCVNNKHKKKKAKAKRSAHTNRRAGR